MVAKRTLGWGIVFVLLAALSVPWFLWGSSGVVAGFPVWLWYHVGWLGLTAVVFYVFTQRAWGVGIEGGETDG